MKIPTIHGYIDRRVLINFTADPKSVEKIMSIKQIGLLDFGLRHQNSLSGEEVFQHLVKETVSAEKLGFSRKWLTEHYQYNKESIWLSPDLLIPLLLAYTDKIKIGTAGILARYRHPMQIASDYKLLTNIFKNRIDLGLAKGAISGEYQQYFGGDLHQSDSDIRKSILEKIEETKSLFQNESHLLNCRVNIPPIGGEVPDLWNLVSSPNGYLDSLSLGMNCSRTIFFPELDLSPGLEQMQIYKDGYFSKFGTYPQINIVVTGSCQKNDKLIKQLMEYAMRNRDVMTEKTMIFGSPERVFDKLNFLAEQYGVEEIIFLENARHFKHRNDSMKNNSEVFDLKNFSG